MTNHSFTYYYMGNLSKHIEKTQQYPIAVNMMYGIYGVRNNNGSDDKDRISWFKCVCVFTFIPYE